jgi:phosphatidylserine synthase
LLAFLLLPLRHVTGARTVRGAPAAAGAAVVFLVHAGLDWDWELPAVVVAGLACLAAVLFARSPEPDPLSRRARAAAVAVALALGAAAIAGTASSARPSADEKAPPSGASSYLGPGVRQ